MVDETRDAEAYHVEEVIHNRVAVLGRNEDLSVTSEGVASECPGAAAQPQIELFPRHRVFPPTGLCVKDGYVTRTWLKYGRHCHSHRA
jgi:hypothetical protein